MLVTTATVHGQTYRGKELTEVALVADSQTLVPGRPLLVGVHMKMAEGWHTYWKFAGDAGLGTEVEWTLPEGFRVSGLEWPMPHRFVEPGDILVNGYKDEKLLMARLFPPRDLDQDEVTLTARVSWLICERICIPGEAEVSLTLRVSDQPQPTHADLFRKFRDRLPVRSTPPFETAWERHGGSFRLTVRGVEEGRLDFFPLPPDQADAGHVRTDSRNGEWTITIPVQNVPAHYRGLEGVLVLETEVNGEKARRGWHLPRPRG